MCTISWLKSLKPIITSSSEFDKQYNEHINKELINQISHVAFKWQNRGKDGIWVFTDKTQLLTYKPFSKNFQNNDSEFTISNFEMYCQDNKIDLTSSLFDFVWVHNRAIPESEEHNDHTQPIITEHFVILHNGIIANDEELFELSGYKDTVLKTHIDTEKFWWYLESLYTQNSTLWLQDLFLLANTKIKGSFAFSIYNKETKEFLLTTNFQPLAYVFDYDYLFFSSVDDYLKIQVDYSTKNIEQINSQVIFNQSIKTLEAYSYIYIWKNYQIQTWSLPTEHTWEHGLVLASGGLDTTVVAGIMKHDYNCKDLTFLHFDYGHKVEEREYESLQNVVNFYNAKLVTIKLDFLKELFKDTPLMTGNVDESWKWMELSLEYVPVRNALFMLLATSYAEVNNINYIWFGWNLSESMSYSDTTQIFIQKINELLPYAIKTNWNIQVLDPLKDLLKHEIVAEGIRVNAPMELTWSCYQDNWTGKHCWVCASCRLRKIWMEKNNLTIEWTKRNWDS